MFPVVPSPTQLKMDHLEKCDFCDRSKNWKGLVEQLCTLAVTFVFVCFDNKQQMQIENQVGEGVEQLCSVAVTPFLSDFCCTRLLHLASCCCCCCCTTYILTSCQCREGLLLLLLLRRRTAAATIVGRETQMAAFGARLSERRPGLSATVLSTAGARPSNPGGKGTRETPTSDQPTLYTHFPSHLSTWQPARALLQPSSAHISSRYV